MLHEISSRKDLMKPSNRDKLLFDDIELLNLAKTTNKIMNWIIVNQPTPHQPHSIKETDRLVI